MAWYDDILGGLTGGLGDMAGSAPQLIMLALIAQMINKQNTKEFGGNPYKDALGAVGTQRTNITDMLNQSQSGTSPNPLVNTMRTAGAERAYNNPLQPMNAQKIQGSPILGNMPGGYPGANTAANQLTMANMMQMLQGSLGNRFGTRAMGARTLTPNLLMQGFTGGSSGSDIDFSNFARWAAQQGAR